MSILDIKKYPDEVLKKIAKPVSSFNGELATLAENMLETMYDAPGIGLAAPQVGESIRMVVIDVRFWSDSGKPKTDHLTDLEKAVSYPLTLVNPEIEFREGKTVFEEGCLSVPGFSENVSRANYIEVKAQNVLGEPIEIKTDGLLAICIQHEIDHLDGKLFIDRLSTLKRSLIKSKIKKYGYTESQSEQKHLL